MSRLTRASLRKAIDSMASVSFTVKDIHNRIPDYDISVVNSAVQRFKARGWLKISYMVKAGGSRFAVWNRTQSYYDYDLDGDSESRGGNSESWNLEPLQEAIKKMRR